MLRVRSRYISQSFVDRLGTFSLINLMHAWMGSLDMQTAYYDPAVDPAFSGAGDGSSRNRMYVLWHEYIPLAFYARGNSDTTILLSPNRDAEWLAGAARPMGFDVIRGSSRRGGFGALRKLMRTGQRRHLAMTPDGPRGPRRKLSSGPIFLASRLRIPIVALGMGYDRPYRLSSWDRFAVPRPRSRARLIWSPEVVVPPKLGRDQIEVYRVWVERILNKVCQEAETWARAGTRKLNQSVLRRPERVTEGPNPAHPTPLINGTFTQRLQIQMHQASANPRKAA